MHRRAGTISAKKTDAIAEHTHLPYKKADNLSAHSQVKLKKADFLSAHSHIKHREADALSGHTHFKLESDFFSGLVSDLCSQDSGA